jgi:gluconokinase
MPPRKPEPVLVVMGVAGCGKSTLAALLAQRLGWPLQEGDALHPRANVDKMAAGQPLGDADRWPWLRLIADWIDARTAAGEPGLVTCSALKRAYRDLLRREGVRFVHLTGERDLLAQRMHDRSGHFMPPSLLESQLATLEAPGADEAAITIDIALAPEAQLAAVLAWLGIDDDDKAESVTEARIKA